MPKLKHLLIHCFRFLLENGANPHISTKEGERPFDLIDKNNTQLVSLLLNYMSVIVESSSKTNKTVNNDAIVLSEHYENAINKIFKKPNRTTEALIDDISVNLFASTFLFY